MAQIVTIDGIPVYQALVDADDTGMLRISLVDDPAVQSDFLAFKANDAGGRKVQTYAVQDEEKRLVLGVVMRADFPIYRRDADGFEYYVLYKAETIRIMAEKYLAENRQNLVNTMHELDSDVEGVQMVECFIKDTAKGIAPAGFGAIADGSLFACFHVSNDDVWEAIKDGTYKGFSLEGIFDMAPEENAEEVARIVDTLKGKFKSISKNKNMAKLKGLLARLARAIAEFGNITTDKGILSWDGDDDLKAGDAVYIQDAEGNRNPAADGDYITDDGKTIVVVDGNVASIADPKAEVAPEGEGQETAAAAEGEGQANPDGRGVATDKGTLYWLGTDDLKEGDDVFIDEEGKEGLTAAPDGDYTTEDGKVISVVDGKVASITDTKAEVAASRDEKMARISAAFSDSYDEKRRKIYEAIRGMGFDGWIVDCGDDFAVLSSWTGEAEKFHRFAISWDEEGNAIASNPVEVVPAFITKEARDAADAEFKAAKDELAALRAQVEELKATPAAPPAHEEFKGQGPEVHTGNKGLDRIAQLMRK